MARHHVSLAGLNDQDLSVYGSSRPRLLPPKPAEFCSRAVAQDLAKSSDKRRSAAPALSVVTCMSAVDPPHVLG